MMDEIDFNVFPIEKLRSLAEQWKIDLDSDDFALKLDQNDPLRTYRDQFYIPKKKDLPNGE